jgi:hypothetical protein
MVFEKLKTHLWILENGKEWQWSDLAKALNTKIIEIDPNRLSRPLSNLMEVIDTKFRANLWDLIPPHPALSLQWPFLFIGLPFFLFRFFRNISCHPVIALAGTSLYLTSLGFISPIAMLSHPAKNMANFFAILSLATITQLYRTVKGRDVSIRSVPHFWPILTGCLCWTLTAFLSDETGLYLFFMLGVVSYPLFLRFKEKAVLLACFFSLPVIYFIIIHFFLPWLHFIVNHQGVDLAHYRDFPSPSRLFFPVWHDFFINSYLLFAIHPGLKWNFIPLLKHPFLISLQCIYTVAYLSLMSMFIHTLYKTNKLSSRIKQILAGLGLLVGFIFFHTFQLSHNVRIWTVFWYGCFFSLIYYVTLTLVLQFLWEEFKGNVFKRSLPFMIVIFTMHGLMTTTYQIRIFKDQSYDPGHFYYPSIFSGRIVPYQYFDLSKSLQFSRCSYVITKLYWSRVKHKNIDQGAFSNDIQSCPSITDADPYFNMNQMYFFIELSYEYPPGRSFLNDPVYVAGLVHQEGEPP